MKKIVIAAAVVLIIVCMAVAVFAQKSAGNSYGETKFKQMCAVCHPGGGNIVNPKKTLHKKDREANNIKTVKDIMRLVRKPGPGMTIFNEQSLSDKDAKAIAKYVIATF